MEILLVWFVFLFFSFFFFCLEIGYGFQKGYETFYFREYFPLFAVQYEKAGNKEVKMVYKALNNLGPSYIREFFKLMTVEYNLRGIGTKLVLPHFNLEWVHKPFSLILLAICGTLYL